MQLKSYDTLFETIRSVRNRPLSSDELKARAIELAEGILLLTRQEMTPKERKDQAELQRMIESDKGKAFVTALTDQAFRTERPSRSLSQVRYLISIFGIPKFIPLHKRLGVRLMVKVGEYFPVAFYDSLKEFIRQKTKKVIIPGETKPLERHLQMRKEMGIRVNLNHLGEAILGEEEAENRLQTYLSDLKNPLIDYISIKISTIYSQIYPVAKEKSLEELAKRYRQLLKAAGKDKFVNLDMEEWRDVSITVELFKMVLDEEEFLTHSAGIVLQSYLPESYAIMNDLIGWSKGRVARGGAPIKIRLVKGANLAMERVEASLRGWPLAPFHDKIETDANFKRMLHVLLNQDVAKAVHVGIGSHNLFDISYALLLSAQRGVEDQVIFELLEGMAEGTARVVLKLTNKLLLYCPVAKEHEFPNAIAYLVRRLDENSDKEHFLRYVFDMSPNSAAWKDQVERFLASFSAIDKLSELSNRGVEKTCKCCHFCNCPDLDFAVEKNQEFAKTALDRAKSATPGQVPICIGEKFIPSRQEGIGTSPSKPQETLYTFAHATKEEADKAVESAKIGFEHWRRLGVKEWTKRVLKVADLIEEKRGDLIAAMMIDGGKTVEEADVEVSETIDFARYYADGALQWSSLDDVTFTPKGVILVASPWNFPCAIPAGGLFASLVSGNSAIFKPAPETVYVGWELAKIFWQAGIPKEVLQFITGLDEEVGSTLVRNPDVAAVILTGATDTAAHLLSLRPGLDLMAETGGKNSIIVTSLADRDLAVKDVVRSAFGHAGQKCSACSLLILEDEVYRDHQFKKQLYDATKSLHVGSNLDLATKVNPLIRSPSGPLLRGLTTLEEGEEWLLEPKKDAENPNVWSPGIKWGVKEGSFTHTTELFGPVLGVMWAKNLEHALLIANGTSYGLTAGLHSLDEREQKLFIEKMRAGNLYLNRTITGAVVQRQPFGGCKGSSFGPGAKAGGPNYVLQMMRYEQVGMPHGEEPISQAVQPLLNYVRQSRLSAKDKELFEVSLSNYQFYWDNYFSKKHDPSKILGQDNLFGYLPHHLIVIRFQEGDRLVDLYRSLSACILTKTAFEVTISPGLESLLPPKAISGMKELFIESDEAFANRMSKGAFQRVRAFRPLSEEVRLVGAKSCMCAVDTSVVANGRLELLHYLREVSISIDTHRFGNLGMRDNELRCGRRDQAQ